MIEDTEGKLLCDRRLLNSPIELKTVVDTVGQALGRCILSMAHLSLQYFCRGLRVQEFNQTDLKWCKLKRSNRITLSLMIVNH